MADLPTQPMGLQASITSPADTSTVGRSLQVSGSVTPFGGVINFVKLQFGDGGPIVDVTPPPHGLGWSWQGLVPNTVRPGQAFKIKVRVDGTRPNPNPEQDPLAEGGNAEVKVVLEDVVPVLTVTPFQTPIVIDSSKLPYALTLQGTVSEGHGPPYTLPRLQWQMGNGPLTDLPVATGIPAGQPYDGRPSAWSVPLSLQPGDYPLLVRASDAFDSVTSFQQTLTVLQFSPPAAPPTPSVTTWTRLEPRCSDADIGASANARLFDPLWLMTRQWQVGEFQAEDAGSLVQARVRAGNATLTRSVLGELAQSGPGQAYDPRRVPLETVVERLRMRPVDANDARMLSLAVEAGLHFLRMLELNPTGKTYRQAFLTRYAMQPLSTQAQAAADDTTLRFVQSMVGRAPDARLLAAALRHPAAQPLTFDPSLNIAAADVGTLQQLATAWLAWYDDLVTESSTPAGDAWVPARLEYAISVAARLSPQPQDAVTLSASQLDGGQLDWSSFDVNGAFSIDTTGDHAFVALNETTVPAPVTFRGAPAARFWELEDATIAYGLVPAGPTDLAHLLMIEYASSYGNDWFVVPLSLPVGSLTRVDSVVVTDTFGVRSLLRPLGDPALPNPYFSMWQCSTRDNLTGAPVSNRFFLPPTIGRGVDGAPLEEVLFMRDEMANLAWAIERSIEGGTEIAVNLTDASPESDVTASSATPTTVPRYLLSTAVPVNWIPLLPVQLDDHGTLVTRLKRGAVLQPDGTNSVQHARSEVLKPLAAALLYDEEVPREGVRVTRRRRLARWTDGSTWLWTAYRSDVGRGEGSAGLRFDSLIAAAALSPPTSDR